ncbi:hypothetical protein MKZ38_001707 [Zalerion maritima]|uniref:Uncharacterized protein n=1 Tax=Zalerion maritima TaxID=339359 RepID=A0AAD5RPT4_9PEZI|nr:hypothetical protein MKZ38_001707 [Zalerion maritima]
MGMASWAWDNGITVLFTVESGDPMISTRPIEKEVKWTRASDRLAAAIKADWLRLVVNRKEGNAAKWTFFHVNATDNVLGTTIVELRNPTGDTDTPPPNNMSTSSTGSLAGLDKISASRSQRRATDTYKGRRQLSSQFVVLVLSNNEAISGFFTDEGLRILWPKDNMILEGYLKPMVNKSGRVTLEEELVKDLKDDQATSTVRTRPMPSPTLSPMVASTYLVLAI